MHIGDFAFPQWDFQIWCEKHIDEAPIGAVIFETIELEPEYCFDGFPIGWKCAIVGPEMEFGQNRPNLAARMKVRKKT
ncbi:hypothetical protein ES705_38396 [subsurface metagenome]